MPGVCGTTEENTFDCKTGDGDSCLDKLSGLASHVSDELENGDGNGSKAVSDEIDYEHEENGVTYVQ